MIFAKDGRITNVGRFYVYGIHGVLVEVAFSALWFLVLDKNLTLTGPSSLWSILLYGGSTMVVEILHARISHMNFVLRGITYVVWTYVFEFTTGYILRLFGACSWDYTWYDYDFMGLVTLEYAPLWFGLALYAESFIKYVKQLHIRKDESLHVE